MTQTILRRLQSLVRVAGFSAIATGLISCSNFKTREMPIHWKVSQQLVVVRTAEWNANHGQLQTYIREKNGGWRLVMPATSVTVGREGIAWGLGMHAAQSGPQKREGDGRAPAGMFNIGPAFGYDAVVETLLPYTPMRVSDWCIDVGDSPLYNQIVDSDQVGAQAVAGSTEPMRRDLHLNGDQRYRIGFVIQHNAQHVANRGSCIFAHLWKAPGEPTAGCTAMSESSMRSLLAWLDPKRQPIFVLLPNREYQRLQTQWQLPKLVE